MNGIVKRYDDRRGFGFITPLVGKPGETSDIYFHASAIRRNGPGGASIPAGAEVRFIVVRGDKGPQAANVELVEVKSHDRLAARPPLADPPSGAGAGCTRPTQALAVHDRSVVYKIDASGMHPTHKPVSFDRL